MGSTAPPIFFFHRDPILPSSLQSAANVAVHHQTPTGQKPRVSTSGDRTFARADINYLQAQWRPTVATLQTDDKKKTERERNTYSHSQTENRARSRGTYWSIFRRKWARARGMRELLIDGAAEQRAVIGRVCLHQERFGCVIIPKLQRRSKMAL